MAYAPHCTLGAVIMYFDFYYTCSRFVGVHFPVYQTKVRPLKIWQYPCKEKSTDNRYNNSKNEFPLCRLMFECLISHSTPSLSVFTQNPVTHGSASLGLTMSQGNAKITNRLELVTLGGMPLPYWRRRSGSAWAWLLVVVLVIDTVRSSSSCGARLALPRSFTPGLPLRRLGGVKGGACAIA